MKPLYVALAMLIASSITGCAKKEELPADPATNGEIGSDNAVVDAVFAAWDLPGSPGCGLAVAQDGTVIYARGYGSANLDYDIPITPQTIFDVASVTKQFVAASIMMLVQDDKLSLDDDVRKWLPELPEYEWPITLRHMLQHSSGLRDYLALFPLAGRGDYYPISHPQILAMMSRQRFLASQPGDRYAYSNTAFMLLAQVVERASGQTIGEFTKARIFEPLGMTASFMYDDLEAIIPQRGIGYVLEDDGQSRVVHNYNFDVAGDGQLYTTMGDLLIWDNYLHGPDEPAIHGPMLEIGYLNDGEPIHWSQGLRRREYRGMNTIGHSGSSWGFRTELVRFVEGGLSVAISCNMGNVNPGQLAKEIADHYLADQLEPRSEAATEDEEPAGAGESRPTPELSETELVQYAGAYFSPELDAIYRFAINDGALAVMIEQEPAVSAVPLGDDRFEFELRPQGWSGGDMVTLQFDRNRAGNVIGFGLSLDSIRDIAFDKGDF